MPKWFYCAALAQAPDQGLQATPRATDRWLLWTWLTHSTSSEPQLIDHFSDQDTLTAYCRSYTVEPLARDHPAVLLQDWQQRQNAASLAGAESYSSSESAGSDKSSPVTPIDGTTLLCAIRGAGIAALAYEATVRPQTSWLRTADGQLALWPEWPAAVRDLQSQGRRPWLYTPQALRRSIVSPATSQLPRSEQTPWLWAQWADDAWGLWRGSLRQPLLWCDAQRRPILIHSLTTAEHLAQTRHPGLWTPPALWLSYHQTAAEIVSRQSRLTRTSSAVPPSLILSVRH